MSILDRIDPAFGYWFAGFTDGEGCFYISRNRSVARGVEYINFQCAFSISLRDDDLPVLEDIRSRLGVTSQIETRAPRKYGTRPMATLTVRKKQDIQSLAEIFDRYPLRAKKRRDYEIWRRAVTEWSSKKRGGGRHLGRHDWTLMESLHAELKAIREYGPPVPLA